jgi:hypothetical protein
VYRPTRRAPSRLRRFLVGVVGIAFVGATLTTLAVATDTFGAGEMWLRVVNRVERFMAGPVPDRPTIATVKVTEPPPETEAPTAVPATAAPGESAAPTPDPTPTPTPKPKRKKVDVDILSNPDRVFAHEIRKDWCAPAGVQMVLASLGLADTSNATQREIAGRVREWEARSDSLNGEWGPAAMALALDAYGAKGYEVRAFDTMTHALRDAAVAIKKTKSPAILLAWRGAHTWVMTGYRADADPAVFRDSKITGAYILDPWYPDISSIWGPSNPPGFFTTFAELRENFLPWKRPEGKYPDRDGLFITVVPTKARAGTG